MLRQTIHKNRDDINRIGFVVKGVNKSLTPITKIDFRILELKLVITNSIATAFPIKWQLDPVETGVMEYQIGSNETLQIGIHQIDVFIYDASNIKGLFFNSFEINVKE